MKIYRLHLIAATVPNASRLPKASMNAPIMWRGVEGERSSNTPTPSEAPAESK